MPKGYPKDRPKPWHNIDVKEEMFDEIVERIVNGESLVRVCGDVNKQYPSPARFLYWVDNNPMYAKRYARAAQIRADVNAEIILETPEREVNQHKARNMMDARRWHNEKMYPKKYGARVLQESYQNINIKQKIDFSALSQHVRQQLREALLKQMNPLTIEHEE